MQLPILDTKPDYTQPGKKPPWLRVKLPAGPVYSELRANIDKHKLHNRVQYARKTYGDTIADLVQTRAMAS